MSETNAIIFELWILFITKPYFCLTMITGRWLKRPVLAYFYLEKYQHLYKTWSFCPLFLSNFIAIDFAWSNPYLMTYYTLFFHSLLLNLSFFDKVPQQPVLSIRIIYYSNLKYNLILKYLWVRGVMVLGVGCEFRDRGSILSQITWCWPWTSQLYHSLGGLLLD